MSNITDSAAREVWRAGWRAEYLAATRFRQLANTRYQDDLRANDKAHRLLDKTPYNTRVRTISETERYTASTYTAPSNVDFVAGSDDITWNLMIDSAYACTQRARAVLREDPLVRIATEDGREDGEEINKKFRDIMQAVSLSSNIARSDRPGAPTDNHLFTAGSATDYLGTDGKHAGSGTDVDFIFDKLDDMVLPLSKANMLGPATLNGPGGMNTLMGLTVWKNLQNSIYAQGRGDELVIQQLDGFYRAALFGAYRFVVDPLLDETVEISSKDHYAVYLLGPNALTYADVEGVSKVSPPEDTAKRNFNWELMKYTSLLIAVDDKRDFWRLNVRAEA